jgi:hypothetical protein
MDIHPLSLLYSRFLQRGGKRIAAIERLLEGGAPEPDGMDSNDDEASIYAALFSDTCRRKFEQLHLTLMDELRKTASHSYGDVIEGLSFTQEIAATGLWKYHEHIGARLESFVRDFDRLDVPEERVRLYESAQESLA